MVFMTSFLGDQAVSGRWRALTRAQLPTHSESWQADLETDLAAFLSIASWNANQDQRSAFLSKLPAIFRAIQDVRISLGEKFTSADIEISAVLPGSPFSKETMEEAYGEEGGPIGPDLVIGTAGLGLAKAVPATATSPRSLRQCGFSQSRT